MAKKKNDLVRQKEEIALVEQEYMERDRLRRVRANRELEEIQESIDNREEARQEANKRKRSFGEFSSNIKKSILKEAMKSLYDASLPRQYDNDKVKAIGGGLIESYVEKNGVDDILFKNRYNSLFLAEMNRLTNACHKAIIESVDENDYNFNFDDAYKDNFFDSVKGEDFDEISDSIRMRVSDAIEDFVQNNVNNKYDIEEVITNTKEKIDNAPYGTSDELKQEYANIGKRRIETIKNRKYGVLEALIQRISKQAIISENMKKAYSDESGKLNMGSIVESGVAIYSFLEMLNTAKFAIIDESFIKEFLNDIDEDTKNKTKQRVESNR